jgi:hypothetical protein
MFTHWKQLNVNKWKGFNQRLVMTIYENYDRVNKKFIYSYNIIYKTGKKVIGVKDSLSEAMKLADNESLNTR